MTDIPAVFSAAAQISQDSSVLMLVLLAFLVALLDSQEII